MGKLETPSVVLAPVVDLIPNSTNSRTHGKEQIRLIANSIQSFGFTNPILIDNNNKIIAGHGRVEAAKFLGITDVPTIRLENLSQDQIRAYVIADNRLAEKAGWDDSILAAELQYLLTLQPEFDISVTGFAIPEIDILLEAEQSSTDRDDQFDASSQTISTSQFGDQWCLGRHRIVCGNATEEDFYSTLLGTKRAEIVFVDPPYNVKIDGNVSGKGAIKYPDFMMASGEMTDAQFVCFLSQTFGLLARYSQNGSVHFVCMDWRHTESLLTASRKAYDSFLNLCVWVKDAGGQGSFYRSRHELVFVFKNGKRKHRNNIHLGRFGRYRTNIWEYPSVKTASKSSDEGNLLSLHPTVKPVALIADALLDSSKRGDIVLDTFLGSGSTLIAAERVGRTCYAIELDPRYVDVAIRRWQRYTGSHAIHASTNRTFNETGERAAEANGE